MIKAVAYLRVSGKSQIDGDGFPRQHLAIKQFAKAKRYEIVNEYRDEGVSGTAELEHREGLAALMDFVEANGVKVVLIERADRLARDLMVGEIILDRFRQLAVKVFAVDSGVDLTAGNDDPTRTLIRQVLGAISQFEKSVIVLKLRAARERIRQTEGRCEGRKPFGANPGEVETLKRMKQLYRKRPGEPRMSYTQIAARLNKEGYPTRQGGPWRITSVRKILNR